MSACNHMMAGCGCHDVRVVARPAKLEVGSQVLVEGADLKPGDVIMVAGQRAIVNDPVPSTMYISAPAERKLDLEGVLKKLDEDAKVARRSALAIADDLIHGERAAMYGPAAESYAKAGIIFDNMLTKRERNQISVSATPPTVVAKMLIALKLVREGYSPDHRDNLIDAAGYIGLLDEMK